MLSVRKLPREELLQLLVPVCPGKARLPAEARSHGNEGLLALPWGAEPGLGAPSPGMEPGRGMGDEDLAGAALGELLL